MLFVKGASEVVLSRCSQVLFLPRSQLLGLDCTGPLKLLPLCYSRGLQIGLDKWTRVFSIRATRKELH